ncbi:MAG: RDD family protein [Balneolaceae bacterium]
MADAADANEPPCFLKRTVAFFIDYFIFMIWLAALFFLSTVLNRVVPFHSLMESSYGFRHSISFLTTTLPLITYFILMERSRKQASVGKVVLGFRVAHTDGGRAPLKCLVIRNVIKFLPWEMAHTIIHLNPALFTSENNMIWLLIIPQGIMLLYAAMIVIRKDNRSIYEILSRTCVVKDRNIEYPTRNYEC